MGSQSRWIIVDKNKSLLYIEPAFLRYQAGEPL